MKVIYSTSASQKFDTFNFINFLWPPWGRGANFEHSRVWTPLYTDTVNHFQSLDYVCWMPCHFSLFSNTCNVSHHFCFMVFWYTCRQIFWNKKSNIYHKWSLLNIISNRFNSLIIFHAEFSKILSHVNITVTFESDIVSAEHYLTSLLQGGKEKNLI